MKLRLSAAAAADLEAIGDWIAKANPARAITFVQDLREACAPLEVFPQTYPVMPRFQQHGVRRKVFGNYLIFYIVQDTTVTVLRILHGARDYESILSDEFGTG